jgi:hypothetical protein
VGAADVGGVGLAGVGDEENAATPPGPAVGAGAGFVGPLTIAAIPTPPQHSTSAAAMMPRISGLFDFFRSLPLGGGGRGGGG